MSSVKEVSCVFVKNLILIGLIAGWGTLATHCLGQGRIETLAITGDLVIDENGFFNSFGIPQLNDNQITAFDAGLIGTLKGASDNTGIFAGTGIGGFGSIKQIVREDQSVPVGQGAFNSFGFMDLNQAGAVAFAATLRNTGSSTDTAGIYRGSGGSLTQIARRGQAAPNGSGVFDSFSSFAISLNESGMVAFEATLTGTTATSGIFRGSGGTITQIARREQAAPDGNGTFFSFEGPIMNDTGIVAFWSRIQMPSGGTQEGIFTGNGGAITQIARQGQAAPSGGTYLSLGDPRLNNAGDVLVSSQIDDGTSFSSHRLYRFRSGTSTEIVRRGDAAPDGNGSFFHFPSYVLNQGGTAAFIGVMENTVGGSADDRGVFRGSGGAITLIAREGNSAPDGNGLFSTIDNVALNDSNVVAFSATLTGTSQGSADNGGLYIGDGRELFQIAREGIKIGSTPISFLSFNGGDRSGLNKYGQVAYRATLTDGRQVIQRFTPDLHWRETFSSTWDTSSRWTLGLTPAQVHDVFIDPAASLTVTGPAANTSVRSLQIGGGTGLATLNLRNGAVLTVSQGVTIANKGTLTGDGVIAGNVINTSGGTILANNLTINSTLTNQGVIRGSGRVDANIVNAATGRIRALGGDQLTLGGASFDNFGLVEVHDSELQVNALFNNRIGTGLVSLQNGTLIAEAGISNVGSTAITAGLSNIHGDINNTGTIQVSGSAQATFFGDFSQNGSLQVASVGSSNSKAVMLGAFSGSGGFTGGGDLYALGDLRPGNSPDAVLYEGNLFLGETTDTFVELAGLDPGEFDSMLITGDLNLAGELFVSLIDGHSLGFNEQYLIGEVGGSLFGQFNGLSEGSLVGMFGGRELFITYGAGDGNDIALFSAIPEPSLWLLLSALIGGALVLRRENRLRANMGIGPRIEAP